MRKVHPFTFYFFSSLIAYLGLLRLDVVHGTLRDQFVPQTIAFYLLAFLFFVCLVIWMEKRPLSIQKESSDLHSIPINPSRITQHESRLMRWVWGTAVFFRLLMLLTTPTLSDDVYRYMWDGYIATEGVSPYAHIIDAPELDHLDIPLRSQANNRWMASPYMPTAQWLFWGLAAIFPQQPLYFQLAMVMFDLMCGALIAKFLALGGFPKRRLILYLLNPFVIIEVAHGAHVDAWMVLLMLGAFWLTFPNDKRPNWVDEWGSPLLMTFATLTKIIPVLALPVLFWRWSWWQRFFYGLMTLGLLMPAGLRAGWGVSGELDGTGLFGALRIYAEVWMFNSALYKWLVDLFLGIGVADPIALGKQLSLLVIVLVLLWVWVQSRTVDSVAGVWRLTAVSLIAYLLLTPTVHPWYTLIVTALLPFLTPTTQETQQQPAFSAPPRLRVNFFKHWLPITAWLYLNATLIFSYLTYLDPQAHAELAWVRHLEWMPTISFLFIWLILHTRNRRLL